MRTIFARIHSGDLLVTAQDFEFGQSEIRVTAGEQLTLDLDNKDTSPHSFDVDEFNFHVNMAGNNNVTVPFTPDKPGTYTFYCGIPGHRELGMEGILIVEPASGAQE